MGFISDLSNVTSIPFSSSTSTTNGILTSGINYVNQPPIITALNAAAQSTGTLAGNLPQLTSQYISALAQNGIGVTNLSNILNSYANYTYHIRLSMTNDYVASSINDPTDYLNDNITGLPGTIPGVGVGKLVIAESGVTAGFNIIDFEINNLCAPGPRVQAMMHTNFTMTLKEPYGFSLLDRIYSFGQTAGISNHLTAPYFIEVWFTGYNEDGSIASLQQLAWRLFRVIITKIDADVTEAGTTYKIEGMVDGAYGNSDHIAISSNGVNITNCRTVGQFFIKLAQALNDQQKQLSYDSTNRVFYDFKGLLSVIAGSTPMKDWTFTHDPTSDARSTTSDITVSKDLQNISISRGMDISTILYFVISMTDQGTQYIAGQSGSGTANITDNGLGNIVAIHTKNQIIGFDYLINDYIRKITYTFTPYVTNRAMIDRNNVSATLQAGNTISRAQVQLNSPRRYKKFYNFLFTGENSDIIKFDIKLEGYWQATLPSQLGENTYSNFTQGRATGTGTFDQSVLNRYKQANAANIQAQSELKVINDRLKNASGDAATLLQQQQTLLQNQVSSTQSTLNQFGNNATQFQVFFTNQSVGQQAASAALGVLSGGISATSTLSALTSGSILTTASTVINTVSNIANALRGTQYLEDQVIINPAIQLPLPISFKQEASPTNQIAATGGASAKSVANTGQTPANIPRTGGLVSAILNDVTSSPFFVKIELEIRGDPYWMGLGNVAENQAIDNMNSSSSLVNAVSSLVGNVTGSSVAASITSAVGNTVTGITSSVNNPANPSAWFYDGETGFLLSFRTGQAPDESTGLVTFNNTSIVFFGLYSVTEVKNKFSNGAFTQVLTGYKDVLLNNTTGLLNTLSTGIEAVSNIVNQSITNTLPILTA